MNPPAALAAWLSTAFLTSLPGMGAVSNRALYLLVAIWLGSLFSRDPALATRARRRIPLLGLIIVFLSWLALTLAWAPSLDGTRGTLIDYLLCLAVFLLVTTFVTEPRHARWLAAAFVTGTVLSILAGVVTGGLSSAGASTADEGRLQGGVSDPNYLAAAIVPAMILAAGLAARRGRPFVRVVLASAAAVLVIGLAATESRGGFLAAAVVAIAALLTWRGRRLTIATMIAVVGCVAIAWFLVVSPASWERISSSGDGGSGRTDIWQVAWRVVEDQPIRGVGLDQFPVVSQDFVREPGALSRADLIVDRGIVVHNVYLQLWAEAGVIGLALLLAIAIGSLSMAGKAVAAFERAGDEETATLARAAGLALVGALTASFFLSNLDDRRVWLLIALGPALLSVARGGAARRASGQESPRSERMALPR